MQRMLPRLQIELKRLGRARIAVREARSPEGSTALCGGLESAQFDKPRGVAATDRLRQGTHTTQFRRSTSIVSCIPSTIIRYPLPFAKMIVRGRYA